jgi:hypothetical protein
VREQSRGSTETCRVIAPGDARSDNNRRVQSLTELVNACLPGSLLNPPNQVSCAFDNHQEGGFGLIATRGIRSPEVCRVERQEKSCKMVGFALVVALLAILPTRAVPAVILFGLSGLSLVWVLFLAPVWLRSGHEEGPVLPEQFVGTAAGMSSAATQVAEVTNDVCHAPMAATE